MRKARHKAGQIANIDFKCNAEDLPDAQQRSVHMCTRPHPYKYGTLALICAAGVHVTYPRRLERKPLIHQHEIGAAAPAEPADIAIHARDFDTARGRLSY